MRVAAKAFDLVWARPDSLGTSSCWIRRHDVHENFAQVSNKEYYHKVTKITKE